MSAEDTPEEKSARRVRREAEIRAKLEAEARASNEMMFSGPIAQQQRARDARLRGERGNFEAPPLPPPPAAPGRGAVAASTGALEATTAAGGWRASERGNNSNFAVPEPARRQWIAGGEGWRDARAAAPAGQPGRLRPLPTGREMVACPMCFRAIPQVEMAAHSAACPARSNTARDGGATGHAGGGEGGEAGEAAEGRVDEGKDGEQEVGQEAVVATAEERRKIAAAAAERRIQHMSLDQPGTEEPGQDAPHETRERAEPAAAAPASLGQCVICMDDAGAVGRSGILCPSRAHYTCAECFTGHVTAESLADLGLLSRRRGRVLCPLASHGCRADPYAHTAVARAVPDEVFDAYMAGCERAAEQRAIASEVEARRAVSSGRGGAGTTSAAAGASGGGAREEAVRELRRYIVDSILTLACPRCGQAFIDFDGCCALDCPRCRCAFCAYCQEDCGTSSAAHSHVPRCAWNARKEVFSKLERFQEAQRERRVRALAAFLGMLDRETRRRVLEACRADIEGVGITMGDVDP